MACATGVAGGPDDTSTGLPVDASRGADTSPRLGYDSSSAHDSSDVPDTSTSAPDTSTTAVDANLPDASVVDSGSSCAFSGTLATYDFSGEPGNQASTPALSSASGITAGNMSRAGKVTPVSGSNSINGSGWSTSSLDSTRYYTFTLTPSSKCAVDLTSIAIDTKASGSGPINAAVATSNDGFAATSNFSTGSSAKVSMSVSGATSAVEIRVYGYDASGLSGTMRVQNTMTITGSLK